VEYQKIDFFLVTQSYAYLLETWARGY